MTWRQRKQIEAFSSRSFSSFFNLQYSSLFLFSNISFRHVFFSVFSVFFSVFFSPFYEPIQTSFNSRFQHFSSLSVFLPSHPLQDFEASARCFLYGELAMDQLNVQKLSQ